MGSMTWRALSSPAGLICWASGRASAATLGSRMPSPTSAASEPTSTSGSACSRSPPPSSSPWPNHPLICSASLLRMGTSSTPATYVDHVIRRHTRHDGTSSLLQPAADDDVTTITGDDNKKASIRRYLPDSHIHRVENGETLLYRQFCAAQRHSAYQKLLVKLDFIQPDSDPEDVLERLKSSTRWSGLEDDRELRYYLKRHMDFLKKYDKSQMGTAYSTSEYENAVSEKINSELSSRLQNDLERSDWIPVRQYYDRMMLRRIARECAIQAQTIGVILVGEAIPKNPEVRMLPLIQRIQGKFGTCAAAGRPWRLLALGILATVATARHQG